METIYDWVSVAIFAGLVVLLMQRSVAEEPSDSLWQYLPPSIGCAIGNYLGNEGYGVFAWLVLAAVVGYILYVLKPFDFSSRS